MASHHGLDANKLQKEGLLKIIYSEEWYFSINQIQKNNDNDKNIVTIDGEKVYRKYFDLIDQVINKEGKKGLRVFGMMDSFFEHGLVDELIDYECMQASKFNEPMVSICVYSDKNIEQLSENQIRRLVLTHKSVML